ncbi:hypothetical protein JCM25156A_04680 [Komagataeibacter kakiaceti JCM 25156]|uniref:MerR family transcriptional regulator n=1 Tax=Komagataeibacter kakiaceti TaxID=943261 RepID=UPI00046FDD53|nr:MerR family transcriptional regulator [Komagataeibacter kakiaceti]
MNAQYDPAEANWQDGHGVTGMDGLPIYDVARELGLAQHVMRMWETRFPQLAPLRGQGGRRYYRPHDIAVLRRIADLLYVRKLSVAEAQAVLGGDADALTDETAPVQPQASSPPPEPPRPELIESVAAPDVVVEEVVVSTQAAEDEIESFAATAASAIQAALDENGEEQARDEAEQPLEQVVMIELERLQAENMALRDNLRGVLVELQALRAMVPV